MINKGFWKNDNFNYVETLNVEHVNCVLQQQRRRAASLHAARTFGRRWVWVYEFVRMCVCVLEIDSKKDKKLLNIPGQFIVGVGPNL